MTPAIIMCDDCQRGYPVGRFLGDRDQHGSRPLQCPHCYAIVGRTTQQSPAGGIA